MSDQTATNLPGQPDGIEDDSHDLPDPHRAADRVRDYIRATGDGLYDTVAGAPLYARDLEAIVRAVDQLADAHAAGARSATQADQARADRDRLSTANKAIITENANVREQLDRANTERQTLAEELATATLHRADFDRLAAERDRLAQELAQIVEVWQAGSEKRQYEVESWYPELGKVLDKAGRSAESPVPSRRAQDTEEPAADAARRFAGELERLAAGLAERGITPAADCPVDTATVDTALAAVDQLRAAQGWDPTTPQWAVIRAATAWRKWYGGQYDPTRSSACNDLAAAVDALPHAGEIHGEHGPEIPAPKLAQGGPVSRGVTLHFDPPPLVVRYIPVPFDPRTGRVL